MTAKGTRGRDTALPGTIGNGWSQVRKANIAYDFGLDPHALAWMVWQYGPYYYHSWTYDSVDYATWALLWTLEYYHEPVITAVGHGNHIVLVIGYNSLRSATNQQGLGEIYQVRIADPLQDAAHAYRWMSYASDWTAYFTDYTDPHDPDPATGWYTPPPDLWRTNWVTVERDDYAGNNPNWAMGQSGPINPYHWPFHINLTLLMGDNEMLGDIVGKATG